MKPVIIGITMGDIGGIGPEVTLKAVKAMYPLDPMESIIPIIFGSAQLLFRDELRAWSETMPIRFLFDLKQVKPGNVYFYNVDDYTDLTIGRPNAKNGALAAAYIEAAVAASTEGLIDAIVTAPICKESFKLAGLSYTGHTSMLQALTGSETVSMAFYTDSLKTVLNSIHIPLKDVAGSLSIEGLVKTIRHAHVFGKMSGAQYPKVAVAGLNPHAGENGMFGREELEIISPAIDLCLGEGIHVSGPYSPDTVFMRAMKQEFDVVVSLYHDQGLIPLKLLAFDEAVNVTVGLPFIRTSPDHGTAFDIAYRQKASEKSMVEALSVAARFAHHVA
jgi:4-hydroxythreonine-4-phosphate dehydrogenase